MYRTALAVSHTLDIDQLLNRIMQLIFEWVEADRGCIMLVDPDTGQLEPAVRRNRKGVKSDDRIKISQTILDYVMEHNEGVLTSNARDDDRWNPAVSILQMGVCEAICVPMRGRYNMVGLIYIDTTISPQRIIQQQSTTKFSDEHLKLMIAIAHQAALAVEDTRYYSAMVQAERLAAVGQTIATLSHHIKNILQGIRGGSFLIKEGLSQHDENMVRKGWEFVEKNQERISNLVMDMLTFSKEREPELVAADMNEVAADVVELMTSRAKEKSVELIFTPYEKMPTLIFDPEGLHRAILNVVTNAFDACDRAALDAAAEDETLISERDENAEAQRRGRDGWTCGWNTTANTIKQESWCATTARAFPPTRSIRCFRCLSRRRETAARGWDCPSARRSSKNTAGRLPSKASLARGKHLHARIARRLPRAGQLRHLRRDQAEERRPVGRGLDRH